MKSLIIFIMMGVMLIFSACSSTKPDTGTNSDDDTAVTGVDNDTKTQLPDVKNDSDSSGTNDTKADDSDSIANNEATADISNDGTPDNAVINDETPDNVIINDEISDETADEVVINDETPDEVVINDETIIDNVVIPDEDTVVIPDEDTFVVIDPTADSDGDGITDAIECPDPYKCLDTDGDGMPNYLDTDSDGDGILDSVEAGGNPSLPVDTDGDGIPNYISTDSDGDGILDITEGTTDTDSDGIPNFIDTDSDGDGIPDMIESDTDRDKDGTPNYIDLDSDGDGILDSVEAGSDPSNPVDTDGDGYANFVDGDSDGDGLTDSKENAIGTNPTKIDTDGDGYDDFTENAFGSNPLDPNSKLPDGTFYFVLPYQDPEKQAPLSFQTKIKDVDVMIIFDVSGSMDGERANIKSGINSVVIPGIKAAIPNTAFGFATLGTWEDSAYTLKQAITTNDSLVVNAINNTNETNGGSDELHVEVLYQAATGEGISVSGSGGCSGSSDLNIAAQAPNYRAGTLPIIIMMSDEAFRGDGSGLHSLAQATAAMNAKNIKFIGIDSSDSDVLKSNYASVSTATGSLDGSNNPFNYTISSDGSGLSNKIRDAVIGLSQNIKMDVNTTKEKITHSIYTTVDTSLFIKSVVPNYTIPANSYTSKNTTTFVGLKPGVTAFFDVHARNDFWEPPTSEATLFKAKINVTGQGTNLDSHDVFIIVPGKKECSGSEGC